jgi:hypothetical protein
LRERSERVPIAALERRNAQGIGEADKQQGPPRILKDMAEHILEAPGRAEKGFKQTNKMSWLHLNIGETPSKVMPASHQ